MMHEHPRGRRFTIETFKLYRRVEHLEAWVDQTNKTISQLGKAGILNNHLLIGPPMIFGSNSGAHRQGRCRLLIRSAMNTSLGLGVVVASSDTTPLPRPSEGWTLDEVSIDDDLRFVPFERCHVMERLILAQRLVPHMRHMTEVLLAIIRHERIGFHHLNVFMPAIENVEAPLPTADWMLVQENLSAVIEQARIEINRPGHGPD